MLPPMLRPTRWLPWLPLLTLAACSCGASTTSSSAAARAPAVSAPEGSADYEVHEWGLVRGGPGDTLTVSAIAPPVVIMPISVDKPVLYFHTAAPFTLRAYWR